ncbi:MAG: hypothetical protein P8013_13000 [Candidatus Sulfobium sp.]|jgi:hypothetical protein
MSANDPEQLIVHLPPGTAIPCRAWRPGPHTDFLVREDSGVINDLSDSSIVLRHGLFLTGEVALVPVMFRIGPDDDRLFETWFNYHGGEAGPSHFRDLGTQENIHFHLYGDSRTREKTLAIINNSKNFFRKAVALIIHIEPWTEDEFDRARAQIFHRHPSPDSLWKNLFSESGRR